MKAVIILSVLAIAVFYQVSSRRVVDPSITGYCRQDFHKMSGCRYRNSARGGGINESPIVCFDQIPGYTNRSRLCVESILCGDKNCDSFDGDFRTCIDGMRQECRSLTRGLP